MKELPAKGVLDAFVIRLSRVVMWISAVIVAVIFYEVVVRYVFSRPTLWAYELAWWLAGILYLFAGLYVMQQRAHIRLTLFYDMMPPVARRVCDVVAAAVLLSLCAAILWGGFNEAKAALLRWEGYGSAWNPPIPATLKPLVIAVVFLLVLQCVSNLWYDWRNPPQSDEHAPDAAQSKPPRQ